MPQPSTLKSLGICPMLLPVATGSGISRPAMLPDMQPDMQPDAAAGCSCNSSASVAVAVSVSVSAAVVVAASASAPLGSKQPNLQEGPVVHDRLARREAVRLARRVPPARTAPTSSPVKHLVPVEYYSRGLLRRILPVRMNFLTGHVTHSEEDACLVEWAGCVRVQGVQ